MNHNSPEICSHTMTITLILDRYNVLCCVFMICMKLYLFTVFCAHYTLEASYVNIIPPISLLILIIIIIIVLLFNVFSSLKFNYKLDVFTCHNTFGFNFGSGWFLVPQLVRGGGQKRKALCMIVLPGLKPRKIQ